MGNLLGLGAGAGEGLLEYLKNQLAQEKSNQEQQSITEVGRHNLASESNQSRQLDQNDQLRRDSLAEKTTNDQALRDQSLNAGIRSGQEAAPIGMRQSGDEVNRAVKAGLPKSNWGPWSPPDLSGQDSAEGPIAPNPSEGMPWLGTQAGIEKLAKDKADATAKANKHAAASMGRDIEQSDGVYREHPDGTMEPLYNPDGSRVKKLHLAPPPVVIQSDSGPLIGDRSTGNTRAFKSPDGQSTVGPKLTGQESDRRDRATTVTGIFDDAQHLLKEANDKGALGPLAGRTMTDFLAGKVGSTGNADTDNTLGELRAAMEMARTGAASLHGRMGANAGIAKDLQKRMDEGYMSYDLINGGLTELKKIVQKYATGNPKAGTQSADPAGDIFQQYLNRTKPQ